LPDTDGFDVLRRIRQQSRTPVLLLTVPCRRDFLANQQSAALLRVDQGVPESALSEIFLLFRRVAIGYPEGAGLGLAIAERATSVHRGTIRSKSMCR